jgi:SWI/SNF-related matrix-associated actin-dependent regulator of chromatin subfamily A-like protein 1
MLDIAETHNGFEVSFQYKPWLIEAVKKIPGARFNGGTKKWWVPQSSGDALNNWAKTFGAGVNNKAKIEIGEIEPLPDLTIDIPLKMNLFPYQRNGVAQTIAKKRVINGDDMGLGKTAQTIASLVGAGAKCILIICPATLKENWKREWKMWTGKEAMVLNDRVKKTWPQYYKVGMCNVFICNYESLKKYFVESINRPLGKDGQPVPLRLNHIKFKETIDLFDAVAIDELHRCKDFKTQLSKFCMGIARGKDYIIGLTGTPVVNKPTDLIAQLQIIGRLEEFGGYKGFTDKFCQGYAQCSNLKELNYLLNKSCFFRRLKKEVLNDLPDKMRSIVSCEITNRVEYNKAEADFINFLKENLNKTDGEIDTALRGEAMVKIGILKKLSAQGKIDGMIEQIQEVVEAGEKIIVFATHKDIVATLKAAIPGAVTVVGDDAMEQRQKNVDAFQNSQKTQVIICNIQSGGVGITLTASSRVAFIELPWHPAHCDQAEDRAWRIGQKNSVQCTYLLGQNTIDEYIYGIIEKKRAIVAQVTGAENNIETEKGMVDDLINMFKGK